jgi:hypothetical protein
VGVGLVTGGVVATGRVVAVVTLGVVVEGTAEVEVVTGTVDPVVEDPAAPCLPVEVQPAVTSVAEAKAASNAVTDLCVTTHKP